MCLVQACPYCGEEVADDPVQQELHLAVCDETRLMAAEREESAGLECGICFENIVQSGRRFGMLSHCAHAYCLPCIRSWRGTGVDGKRDTVRACPLCREESHFVIPSDRMLTDPTRKERVIEQYKLKMGQISCKHFTKGSCPFGTSCFYAHINEVHS